MKHSFNLFFVFLGILGTLTSQAQTDHFSRKKFFSDSSTVDVNIVCNMGRLFRSNPQGFTVPATLSMKLPDGSSISSQVQLEIRGHMRHDYCYVPPLKVTFEKNAALGSLKSLKLVNECKVSQTYDQYLLKEYVCYKIYNLISDMSFRARLLNVTFTDSSGKKKPLTEHGFLLEDIKDVAKRNDCELYRKSELQTEQTNRRQMTVVAIFEYLIGNTDWAVPVNHNTKLIYLPKDSANKPFVVPYDFDYAGIVNTEYAVPDERLDIENVRQRLYRGYPRTMVELNDVLEVFKAKKAEIYDMVKNLKELTPKSKNDITSYLDDFYKSINKQGDIKSIFIDNARRE
ncbi:MAG TPA: hypothetical protein VKR32_02700 [Puia sp.]|nr:hypothetical protein [Puia sp.]